MRSSDILLFERLEVEANEVRGKAVPYSPNRDFPFKAPLMKGTTDPGSGNLPRMSEWQIGFAVYLSGRRSFLIGKTTGVYRVKGGGYEDGPILDDENGTRELTGGQLKKIAMRELEANDRINRILEGYGFLVAAEPAGYFDYEGFPCTAGVYMVSAETRMDELLRKISMFDQKNHLDTLQRNAVRDMLDGMGRYMGSLLALLHENQLCWGSDIYTDLRNAHIGNFVVGFESRNSLFVGMVDFDHYLLASCLGIAGPRITRKHLKEVQEYERKRIKTDIETPSFFSMWGDPIPFLPSLNKCLGGMAVAFDRGYETMDSKPVQLDISLLEQLRTV